MYFLICIGLVLLSIVAYWRTHRVSIAFINCAIWAFLSIAVVALDLPKDVHAFSFVFLNILIFAICHVMIPSTRGQIQSQHNTNDITEDQLKFEKVNKITVIIALLGLVYLAYSLGFRLRTFTSVSSLMSRMNAISHMRYSDDGEYLPLINRFINSFSYAVCGYAGFYFAKKFKKEYFYNLIIIAAQTVITNTKATLVFAIAFFAGGFLTGFSYFGKRINLKRILIVVAAGVGIVVFSTLIDYFRHAGQIDMYTEFQKIISAYFVGPYSAFSIWFGNDPKNSLEMGANTFSSIFRLLGIAPQTHGDFVLVNGVSTNVYTIYKHLINDYSLFGTVLISAIMGWFSAFIDNKVKENKRSFVGISIVVMATVLIAFFSSLYRYTVNVLAALIIIWVSLPIRFSVRRR
jgi:oligosaccharide repeat unit polymerase